MSNGIAVSFAGDGQAVTGSMSGVYAAPYLSNGNGTPFGDPNNGPDTTRFLTTGVGSVTLVLPGEEKYVGLLWGSVDNYNTLSLYNGSTLVGTEAGMDVTASATGDQGASGTFYVNINSRHSFDPIVATSSSYAFEFDNVAYNQSAVPEPSSFVLALIGVMGAATYTKMRRKGLTIGNKSWSRPRSPGLPWRRSQAGQCESAPVIKV